jgi:1,2-phenylacetyl-CoA epoxidase catalytic subunit
MDSQNIIAALEKAKYWEDEFILKYDTPEIRELLQSLPQSTYTAIMKLLEKNLADTRYHKKTIETMIKGIQNGKYTQQ